MEKKERKREEERLNDGNNNDKLRIAKATSGGTRKSPWANAPWNRGCPGGHDKTLAVKRRKKKIERKKKSESC